MFWHKVRSGLMLAIAFIASPCCAPLIVPLVLALLAATPGGIWLSYHTNWVYGVLTVVSIISLVLGWRWIPRDKLAKYASQLLPSNIITKTAKVFSKN